MKKRYLTVESIAFTNLNNAEFLQLMRRVIARLPRKQSTSGEESQPSVQSADDEDAEISEELYIDKELVEELESYLDKLDDLTRETTASLNTEEIQKLDDERNKLAGYIISTSLQATHLPIEAKCTAGKEVYIVVKPYEGIAKEPDKQKTTLINNMLGDIQKNNLSSQMTLLGIDDVAAQLQQINDRYEQLSAERDKPKARERIKESSAELRASAMEVYQEIADRAFAANLLHPTEATEEYILDLNNELLLAEEDYNRRKKSDGEKTPSTGEEPADDKPSDQKPADEQPDDETPDPSEPTDPSNETPDGENPSTETPGGDETPEEPDDRPVVQ